jgi:integrase
VTLKEAVERAHELRKVVRSGADPVALKRERRQRPATDGKTLRDALTLYAADFKDRAGARAGVKLIERHAATLLTRPLGEEMTAVEVKTALTKVQESHPRTSARTRAALSALFSFCIGHGWRQGNPCDRAVWRSISPPAPKSEPYKMMPLKLLPAFWQRLLTKDSVPSLALAFTIATAARQAETTGLVWDDLDLDARLMIVPPHKMKMRREHRQPLSDAAVDVIDRVRAKGRKSSHVFLGLGGSRMGSRTMENLMHRQEGMPYSAHATARACFSTALNEKTKFAHEDIELCLAHLPGTAISRSYNHSDAIEKRRAIIGTLGTRPAAGQTARNRPGARVPEFGPCTGGVRQKAAVDANGKMRGAERGDPSGVSSRIGLRHAHVKRDPP